MGWANCGKDTKGRPRGYVFNATCDHPDCLEEIDRGLSYACGDMHGEDEISCEKYFCQCHLYATLVKGEDRMVYLCRECFDEYERYLKEVAP